MAAVDDVFEDPKGILAGDAYGNVFPKPMAPALPMPDVDARTIGIDRLLEFVSRLRFARFIGPGKPSQPFNIPLANLFDEQPSDITKLAMPSIAVVPTVGQTIVTALGPAQVIDDSIDKYGPGTALLDKGTYTETLTLEIWASSKVERRSVVAGLKAALTSMEDSYSLRLTLPDYFDQVASYTLQTDPGTSQNIDDPDVIRNRRRALVFVLMEVPEVQLIRANKMKPSIQDFVIAPNHPELKLADYPGAPDPKNGPGG